MGTEHRAVKSHFAKLLGKNEAVFPMPRKTLEASVKHGVYIILGLNGSVLHVGRTVRAKGGISQRLKNHLYGKSSFTKKHLRGNGAKLRGRCKYKYLEVPNPRLRALLEAYAIGKLCPKHLG